MVNCLQILDDVSCGVKEKTSCNHLELALILHPKLLCLFVCGVHVADPLQIWRAIQVHKGSGHNRHEVGNWDVGVIVVDQRDIAWIVVGDIYLANLVGTFRDVGAPVYIRTDDVIVCTEGVVYDETGICQHVVRKLVALSPETSFDELDHQSAKTGSWNEHFHVLASLDVRKQRLALSQDTAKRDVSFLLSVGRPFSSKLDQNAAHIFQVLA
ncbi:hypothetical protein OGAPHI_001129 [Ogataea philodendri]|uniref:Uncharacterized protein n=1 Tax=Ogataea philodendri TaxID=1378263 RepID=A0A9P8PFP9_9ASCO|nr:uncharacterized protein OGAPHI_001129 [Ogataea philodendri]KAH3670614.1 hypothetical protein OGAPHI_001129 [Ogataea philodendri]